MFDQSEFERKWQTSLKWPSKLKTGEMLTCWEYASPVNDLVENHHARISSYCTVVMLAITLTSRIWSHQRKKKSGCFCKTWGKSDLPDGTWHDYWC